jgi:hypothetical protein
LPPSPAHERDAIAYVSADLPICVQYLIMAVIVASLVSIGMAAATGSI